MGNTIKYWVVANLGVVIWLVILFIGLLDVDLGDIFGQKISDLEEPKRLKLQFWFMTLWLGGMCCWPTKRMMESVFRYFLLFGVLIYVIYVELESFEVEANLVEIEAVKRMIQIFWIGFGCSHLLALLLAVYTYQNFDEVVSRRMLYRNSAVDMFEEQLKYTICRFMDHASAFFWMYLTVVAILWIHSAINGNDSFMGIPNAWVLNPDLLYVSNMPVGNNNLKQHTSSLSPS